MSKFVTSPSALETIVPPELTSLRKVVPDNERKARLIFMLEDFSASATAFRTEFATIPLFMA